MAKLRLFSAAFPWQCELPDSKRCWSFGTLSKDDHRLPDELIDDQFNSKRDKTLFCLQQSECDRWEILNVNSPDDPLKAEISSKLNGKSFLQAVLNDGDIITLGEHGHIFVAISRQLSQNRDSVNSVAENSGNISPKIACVQIDNSIEGAVNPLNGPKSIPDAIVAANQSEQLLPSTALKKFSGEGQPAIVEKENELQANSPDKKRLYKRMALLTVMIIAGSLFWAKKPLINQDLINANRQTLPAMGSDAECELGRQEIKEREIKPHHLGEMIETKAPSEPMVAKISLGQNALSQSLDCNARADTWPILIKASSPIIRGAQSQLMQRVDLSNENALLTNQWGWNTGVHKSPQTANELDRPISSPLTKTFSFRSQKISDAGFESSIKGIAIASLSCRCHQELQTLVDKRGIIKWLKKRWSFQSHNLIADSKLVENCLIYGQLRMPLGPPLPLKRDGT